MSTLSAAQRRLEQRLRQARVPPDQLLQKQNPQGAVPVSFTQQRLWLLQQADPDSGYYNLVRALWLRGALDVGALERSLAGIVRRHGALRTIFPSSGGAPLQLVQPFDELALEVENVEGAGRCRERVLEFTAKPFRLESDLPFRYRLYRTGEDAHCLALVFHHICADGWALRLALGELARDYSGFVRGEQSDELEPALDYLDFTASQRAESESSATRRQCDYWANRLRGVPEMLALPLDRSRPVRSSHRGATGYASISADAVSRLRKLALSTRVTVFAALLAALESVLSRYARQQDFAIAAPVSGRTKPELEPLIGCLANTVFLRSSINADITFRELVQRTAHIVNQALENQEVPFERVMDHLHREHGQHPPKLQVLFALQGAAEFQVEMAGLECTVSRPATPTSRCDLTLFAIEQGSGIDLEAEYDADLFDAPSIARFLAHYCALLDSALADPDTPVAHLAMLSGAELRLLDGFNETTRPYPAEPAHVLFERHAAAAPDAPAIVDGARRLTYRQLDSCANQVANYLRSKEVRPGDLVAVSLPRTAHLVGALLGVWKAGAAWVPLDPDEPSIRARKILADCGAKLLLAGASIPWRDVDLPVASIDEALAHPDDGSPALPCRADQLAYVMYTSGSTGQPKGVEIPHRAIARLVSNTDYAEFGPDRTFLAAAPFTFDASTFELWGALLNGGKCVIYPGRVPEPPELERLIAREGITTAWLTASLFNAIVDEKPQSLGGLKQLLIGGEALSAAHVRRALEALPATKLINGYGPTENTTFTCCWPIPPSLAEGLPAIPIGMPIANTRVHVLDEYRRPCGIDVPGEIYIGGDGLAIGYRNSPQLTADRFVIAPWGERLYRSGDLGRWRSHGAIEFLGRLDSQVKIRGFRIETAEVEAALAEHPDVEEAFVVPIDDAGGPTRLAAYVKPRTPASLTEAGIRAHVYERLPAFLAPAWYCMVPAIPRNANGKRDAAALPRPRDRQAEPDRPPCGETENKLLEIVRELLPEAACGVDANLFEAGLDSLLASRLRARIDRDFGHALQLSTLYTHPTVAGIAGAIETPVAKVEQAPAPFFFAHAGPMFRHLAARLTDRPFYGVGFSSPGPAPLTIAEHARNEAEAILRIHPGGPYLIGGWSASGVLAVEIARQLTELGHTVSLVVLFDAPNYAHFRNAALRRRAARWLRSRGLRFLHHLSTLSTRPVRSWADYLRARIRSIRAESQQVLAEVQYRRGGAALDQMDESRLFVAMARRHSPAPYNGRVLLLRRKERAREWGDSWDLGWRQIVTGQLEIQTIAGDHLSIFEEPHVESMAGLLRQRLREAAP